MFSNRPAMKRDYKPREEGDSFGSEGMEGIRENLYFIRDSVQRRILAEFEGEVNQENHEQLRQMIEVFFNQLLVEENLLYTRANRQRILDWVVADIIGYGPLEPLLNDDDITEIMVNGYNKVYIERHGRIETTKTTFEDETHLRRIIDRIVAPIGRRVDESSPMVDARLPSGFRVNATIPPLSLEGPLLTIRKFATVPYTAQDLISNGTLNAHLVGFLQACVQARINMVISGGTGSGKTTLLNLVSAFIPETERVITIEDIAELRLVQDHVIRLEKKPPNIEGRGEVTIRQLVVNALRMRPDRIIVGESRSGEALDMLQAMNTGHAGSMTTIHSNSPRDSLRRIETMVLMAGVELPLRAIREQISSAIELVVHLDRMRDGTRKVVSVTEVQGMEGETVVLQDIFNFDQTGFKNGRVVGKLKATGLRPSFAHRFEVNDIRLPENIFDPDND